MLLICPNLRHARNSAIKFYIQNDDNQVSDVWLLLLQDNLDPIRSDDAIAELGRHFGKNTRVERLKLQILHRTGHLGLDKESKIRAREVLEKLRQGGLCQNKSIKHLILNDDFFSLGFEGTTLISFFLQNNPSLQILDMKYHWRERLSREQIRSIMTPLSNRSAPLEFIDIGGNEIGDPGVIELVNAFKEHPDKTPKKIDLSRNIIGWDGCNSLAELLQMPNCTLEQLDLYANRGIGDNSVMCFANSLAKNTTLRILRLDHTSITTFGLMAFGETLCNTESIVETFSCNHTITSLFEGSGLRDAAPENIRRSLDMNQTRNKNAVGRQKVLETYFRGDFAMEAFNDIDAKVLVFVPNFIDKALAENQSECDYGNLQLSFLFKALKCNPHLCKK